MSRIENLKSEIRELYEAHNPNRADWSDWLYANHVFLVADYAQNLAQKLGVDNDLSAAAALLHDIADAVMKREDPEHENKSVGIARALLLKTGFNEDEIKIIIDDALRFHSCHENEKPQTIEGKILATADGAVHLNSDFYDYANIEQAKTRGVEEAARWCLAKIERDYHDKVLFEEVRQELTECYNQLKEKFRLT
jgi:putative nucleotidyltransferase with HDIG domain